MNITTNSAPPRPGVSTVTWEGYIRADEILSGDRHVPSGEVVTAVALLDGGDVRITNQEGDNLDCFADEMLYMERTVTVIVSLR